MPRTHPPCSCSVHAPTKAANLTATASDDIAACKARHLAMCRELAELAMAMARATAHCAVANPPDPEKPETLAQAATLATAFARLSNAARQAITLEARILAPKSAPAPAHAARHTREPPPPDPRRAPVKAALVFALENHPNRAELKTATADFLEEALAADPDQTLPISTILDNTCDEYGLDIDFGRLPDDLLDEIAGPDPP